MCDFTIVVFIKKKIRCMYIRLYFLISQGLTLAMCPLVRTHSLGGRASSGRRASRFFFFFIFEKCYEGGS